MRYEINLKTKIEMINGTEQPSFSYVTNLLSQAAETLPEPLAKLREYVYAIAGGNTRLADVFVFRAFADKVSKVEFQSIGIACEADRLTFDDIIYKNGSGEFDRFVCRYPNDTEAAYSIVEFMLEKCVNLGICLNCGRLFTPYRRDLRYCSRPISAGSPKTCIDVGAKLQFYNRTVSDPVLKKAKNIAAKLCNRSRRNPDNAELQKTYEDFVQQRSEWQRAIKKGERTTSDYSLWLDRVNEETALKKS